MAVASHEKKRGFGPQSVARTTRRLVLKGAGKRPPLLSNLSLDWPGVVGTVIGERTLPIKFTGGGKLAAGGRRPQTLVLKVDGAWATEVNHQAPLLIERINSYFGWRAVDRIALQQGLVPKRKPKRRAPPAPTPEIRQKVNALTRDIATDDLRATLTRLGETLLAARSAKTG